MLSSCDLQHNEGRASEHLIAKEWAIMEEVRLGVQIQTLFDERVSCLV